MQRVEREDAALYCGSRRPMAFGLVGRDALYRSQQLGQRHSALSDPRGSTWRTTRHPKRMLRRVDDSVSSSPGGGVAPQPQHDG
jgi:hypothetical protein